MEVTGTIKQISDTHVVSERFKKRDFVLTIDESSPYPQHVSFQVVQDKVNLLDTIKPGYEAKVLFNLKGREWTSPQGEVKYFNTLDAWRIEILSANATQEEKHNVDSHDDIQHHNTNDADDDLPF